MAMAAPTLARLCAVLFVVAALCIGKSWCDGMPILRSARSAGYPLAGQTVTLAHGKHRGEGNVQILYRQTWGAVCDDNWHPQDAAVVCRELGFASVAGITVSNKFRGAAYPGFGYALDEADCDGTEASLAKCAGQWGSVGNCKQVHEWAGVRCGLSECLPGFSGKYCCPATAGGRASASASKYCCPAGTAGRRCHHSDAATCSGRGAVDDAGSCACAGGFLGKHCQYSSTSCNGNGEVDEHGICSCDAGFFAPHCLPYEIDAAELGSGNRTFYSQGPAAEASLGRPKNAAEATVQYGAAIVAGLVVSILMVLAAANLVAKKKRKWRKLQPELDALGFDLPGTMPGDGGEAGVQHTTQWAPASKKTRKKKRVAKRGSRHTLPEAEFALPDTVDDDEAGVQELGWMTDEQFNEHLGEEHHRQSSYYRELAEEHEQLSQRYSPTKRAALASRHPHQHGRWRPSDTSSLSSSTSSLGYADRRESLPFDDEDQGGAGVRGSLTPLAPASGPMKAIRDGRESPEVIRPLPRVPARRESPAMIKVIAQNSMI